MYHLPGIPHDISIIDVIQSAQIEAAYLYWNAECIAVIRTLIVILLCDKYKDITALEAQITKLLTDNNPYIRR